MFASAFLRSYGWQRCRCLGLNYQWEGLNLNIHEKRQYLCRKNHSVMGKQDQNHHNPTAMPQFLRNSTSKSIDHLVPPKNVSRDDIEPLMDHDNVPFFIWSSTNDPNISFIDFSIFPCFSYKSRKPDEPHIIPRKNLQQTENFSLLESCCVWPQKIFSFSEHSNGFSSIKYMFILSVTSETPAPQSLMWLKLDLTKRRWHELGLSLAVTPTYIVI